MAFIPLLPSGGTKCCIYFADLPPVREIARLPGA
jgi:hypothetical protein